MVAQEVSEVPDGWFADPFGRYEERYFVYGEPSRLVRTDGIEATDPSGAEPSPGDESPRALDAVSLVLVEEPDTRSMRGAWAVLTASCAIGALVLVNIHVSSARRLPLLGVACVLGVLAAFGAVRAVTIAGPARRDARPRNRHKPSVVLATSEHMA